MANPNIVAVTSIIGTTETFALTTSLTTLVTCAANHVYKINSIIVTNIDGTNAADVTVNYNDGANTRAIGSTISVPADAALNLVDKNSGFYLMENDIISGLASANSDLVCLISYEDIS